MSQTIRNITVLGAGGELGVILVNALQKQGYKVSAVTGPTNSLTFGAEVTVHRLKYSDFDGLVAAFTGQDVVISTIGTFGAAEQLTAVDAAAAAGVQRFLPSEYGGNTSLQGVLSYPPFAKDKRNVVEHLQSKEAQGLSWTALCTGIFFSWVLEQGAGTLGWDVDANKATIYDSGDQKFDTSTVEQLVRAVTSILKHPEETRNTYVFVNSFTLTQNKVLSALERLQGKKYEVSKDTTASVYASGTEKLSLGDVAKGYPEIITASVYAPWNFTLFPADEVTKWKEVLELTEVDDSDEIISSVLRKKGLLPE